MKKDYSGLAKYFAQAEEDYCNLYEAETYMAANATPVASQMCVNTGVKDSDPYIITVTNSYTIAQNYTLFGANFYALDVAGNYGSDPGIVITVDSRFPYTALLLQSITNKFNAHIWRMDAKTQAQLSVPISVNYYDMNGNFAGKRISMAQKKNIFANNAGLAVEFVYDVKIDGGTYFTSTMIAGDYITFTINPSNVVDVAQSFITPGGMISKNYNAGLTSYLPTQQVSTMHGLIEAGQGKG